MWKEAVVSHSDVIYQHLPGETGAELGKVGVRIQIRIGHCQGAQRLRWSRGSVLAFGTQVRGFKPGRSRRIFKGK